MPKLITKLDDFSGKTVAKTKTTYDHIYFVFTNGDYAVMSSTKGYYGESEEPILEKSWDLFTDAHNAVCLSLVSIDEVKAYHEASELQHQKEEERRAKQVYEQLKARFEK